MSLTRTVPPGVPSLLQSSVPCSASVAEKRSVPFTSVSQTGRPSFGAEDRAPAPRTVPAGVPSERQSGSRPLKTTRSADPAIVTEASRRRARVAGLDDLHERRPGRRAVASPELETVGVAVDPEEQSARNRGRRVEARWSFRSPGRGCVPAAVPSLAQSCEPLAVKSRPPDGTSGSAARERVDEDRARLGAVALPGRAVRPEPGSRARLRTERGCVGYEPAAPGTMSRTRTVPGAVPSLFQSSEPCAASVAAKKRSRSRSRASRPYRESASGTVPASVPSLRQRPQAERRTGTRRRGCRRASTSSGGVVERAGRPGREVLHELRPRRGAVARPELRAVDAVVDGEEETTADLRRATERLRRAQGSALNRLRRETSRRRCRPSSRAPGRPGRTRRRRTSRPVDAAPIPARSRMRRVPAGVPSVTQTPHRGSQSPSAHEGPAARHAEDPLEARRRPSPWRSSPGRCPSRASETGRARRLATRNVAARSGSGRRESNRSNPLVARPGVGHSTSWRDLGSRNSTRAGGMRGRMSSFRAWRVVQPCRFEERPHDRNRRRRHPVPARVDLVPGAREARREERGERGDAVEGVELVGVRRDVERVGRRRRQPCPAPAPSTPPAGRRRGRRRRGTGGRAAGRGRAGS